MPPRVTLLLNAPPDSWIALAEDETRIVGTGRTFEEAARKAEAEGIAEPLIIKIPKDWTPRVLWERA